MTRSRFSSFVTLLAVALALLAGAGVARAVDHATIELQLIWGSNDEQSPDPNQKPVDPEVEKLLSGSPYRWKHYYLVNRRIEDIDSANSKDKIPMSVHCEMDIKYLGGKRIQVKLYGDKKLLSTHRESVPLLLAGDAQNDTAWLVLIRMAPPKAARGPELMPLEEAQIIGDKFRADYAKMGSPRFLIYVNRDLVGAQGGLRLTGRTERVETTSTSSGGSATSVTSRTTADNTYGAGGNTPTLADQQTTRDVERLIGGQFRAAGATLVDQGVATQLIGDRPLETLALANDQAKRSREAVAKVADVAIEVLLSSRQVKVAEVAGDKTYNVPDLQLTAIRLSDAKVIGQASSMEVMNRVGGAGYAARNFGNEAIIEATGTALMDDINAGVK